MVEVLLAGWITLAGLAAVDSPAQVTLMPEAPATDDAGRLRQAHVRAIAQDAKGRLWFGTDGAGLCRYDDGALTFFTEKDGLPNNFVRTLQFDEGGTLWLTTRDGLSRFDGTTFTRVELPTAAPTGEDSFAARPPEPDALWFAANEGVAVYDGTSVRYLPLPLDPADVRIRREQLGYWQKPYSVYSVLKHHDGTIWMGTEARGACRWDGANFSWIRGEDIEAAAIRSICVDSRGDVWLGNSGVGLFRYHDGKLTNFGVERGIDNRSWLQNRFVPVRGRIANPHAILETKDGVLWFGTYDSGLWRYDGKEMKAYTMEDGLPTDSISSLHEDEKGVLWVGTFLGVCNWDGKNFQAVR